MFYGAKYIPEACRNGAVALLSDLYDPCLKDIAQIICPDIEATEAFLANVFFNDPSQELFMIGATGTSGKTTTTYAIKHLIHALKESAGLIGGVEYAFANHHYPASYTTPDVICNNKLLREMVRAGCSSCVMEVSSHGLDQNRVDHIEYDVAIFTNLSHEHMDYHKSIDAYFEAKKKLFTRTQHKKKLTAVINNDSQPWAKELTAISKATVITYAIDNEADLKASRVQFSQEGTHFTVSYKDKTIDCFILLIGRFNVYNMLAAMAALLAKGFELDQLVEHIKTFRSAPGRVERVENSLGLNIFVDYSHKPDALENVLKTLRECSQGKIITLFGCGGDRDREKRPKMGLIAEQLSDKVIITSDNPRTENPQAIIKEIEQGLVHRDRHTSEVDRKLAIEQAIDLARPGDTILIAGKGHETKQYFAHHMIDFDDRLIAKQYCQQKSEIT